ncbi:hypothetical protein, partial [Pantoea dispersa]
MEEEEKNTTPTGYEANEELHDTTDSNISLAFEGAKNQLRLHRQEINEELESPAVQSVLKQFHVLPRTYLTEFKTDMDNNFD